MEEKNIMKEKNIAQSLVQAYQNRVDERDDEQIKKWLSENRYAEKTVDNLSDDDYLKNALKEFQYYQTSKKRDSFAEKLNQRGKKKKITTISNHNTCRSCHCDNFFHPILPTKQYV